MKPRELLLIALVLVLVPIACSSNSAGVRQSARIVGTWELLSYESAPGAPESPIGSNPVGLLIYDSHGNVSAQLMRREPGGELNSVTPANPAGTAAVAGYIAYFGTYEIDWENSEITHHIKAAVAVSDVGRTLTRKFRFERDVLVLELGSGNQLRTLRWRRVENSL